MASVYHILYRIPAISYEDMEFEYELLAQELIKSGKLRIDTDHHCNFARFADPGSGISLMVSKEELVSKALFEEKKQFLRSLFKQKSQNITDEKIEFIFNNLRQQITKLQPVSLEVTTKLARIFIQAAHPIVIKWLLHDKVEVFITYSHNIGDMMDIYNWKNSGTNSGMQSTDGRNVAIFVSCGGDPFGEINDSVKIYGNGVPAIARLQIIAAQELGHFADIKRNEQGMQISRHSANFSCTKATEKVKKARKNDIANCDKLLKELLSAGMDRLIFYDETLKFYHDNKIAGIKIYWFKFMRAIYKYKFLRFAAKKKLFFIRNFALDKYMALMIRAMIEDMKFNLDPVADVYRNDNKEIEEAIKCIEALARVPQQVMKWGYITTMTTMKGLYTIYYNEVIQSLIHNYNIMTGENYKRDYKLSPKSFKYFISKLNPFVKNKQKLQLIRELD
jgi:hypothetical protein